MRKLFPLLFLLLPQVLFPSEIRSISVETTRMSAQSLAQKLGFKEGDEFDLAALEREREKLQNLHIFRTLDFLYKEEKDGLHIRIRADDHTYLMTMGMFVNGKKRSGGVSVLGRNFLKQGEDIALFVGGGRDGFNTRLTGTIGRHRFGTELFRMRFEQGFYENGWVSAKGIFSPTDDKGKYESVFLGSVKGTQKNFSVSYGYQISSVWSASLVPEYEYYRYDNAQLDTGNHAHISVGIAYNDAVSSAMDMSALNALEHLEKADILRDLSHLRTGKTAQVSYLTGGRWSGSDFALKKWTAQGKYMWEFPSRQAIALFAKVQYAQEAPFSNQVESSELLFGMGIYDREQRGKHGFSGGVSWTYFPLRNKTGILSLVPFYELAFISAGQHYTSHSGVGISLGYRLWRLNLPLSFTFTHNLTDGSHHAGCKLGGHF